MSHTTTQTPKMTEEQIAFAVANWNRASVIATILDDMAKHRANVEATTARDFFYSVVSYSAKNVVPLDACDISFLASTVVAWAYSRGYSDGRGYMDKE